MTLPKKNEKELMEIEDTPEGFRIVGRNKHIAELAALLRQRGVECEVSPNGSPEERELHFKKDRARASHVLEQYKAEKGS